MGGGSSLNQGKFMKIKNSTSQVVFALFLITLGIGLAIGIPLISIWGLNTLFGLSIAINLKTWFAAFVLVSILRSITQVAASSNK